MGFPTRAWPNFPVMLELRPVYPDIECATLRRKNWKSCSGDADITVLGIDEGDVGDCDIHRRGQKKMHRRIRNSNTLTLHSFIRIQYPVNRLNS